MKLSHCLRLALIALCSVLIFPTMGFGATHGLIIGVGQYPDNSGVDRLEGTSKDIERATEMARALGATPNSIRILRDAHATKPAILKELDQLHSRVKEGDFVFIYFSSHGVRYESGRGQCREAILPYVAKGFTTNDVVHQDDIQKRAIQISKIADKVILMADTCHSGGLVAVRSLSGSLSKIKAKSANVGKQCDVQENSSTPVRGLLAQIREQGSHEQNFVQIAAAGPREASWDTPDGGLSTKAIASCLLGEAIDLNRSGAVTVDEVRDCAQKKHNQEMLPFAKEGKRPSTIQITGSRNIIASVKPVNAIKVATNSQIGSPPKPSEKPPSTAPDPPGTSQREKEPVPPKDPDSKAEPSATTFPSIKPPFSTSSGTQGAGNPVITQPQGSDDKKGAVQGDKQQPQAQSPSKSEVASQAVTFEQASVGMMEEIFENRNPRIQVEVVSPSKLKVGQDEMQFTVKSSIDGYLYVLMLGSDRESFYMLFPNGIDDNNKIVKGRQYAFPRPTWSLRSEGPPGLNRMLFVVTETPRFSDVFVNSRGGGDIARYASSDISRSYIMNHFMGAGVKGSSKQYGAVLRTVMEIQ
jgi:hypothetical protein